MSRDYSRKLGCVISSYFYFNWFCRLLGEVTGEERCSWVLSITRIPLQMIKLPQWKRWNWSYNLIFVEATYYSPVLPSPPLSETHMVLGNRLQPYSQITKWSYRNKQCGRLNQIWWHFKVTISNAIFPRRFKFILFIYRYI